MAKFFSYTDIERPVLLAGFVQVKNNGGSHQVYRQEETGLMVTIPKHPSGVSIGVGECVLAVVVLAARLLHINIGAKSNKYDTNVANFILFHQSKCKENPMFLIPEEVRTVKKIETVDDVKHYLSEQENRYKQTRRVKQDEYIRSVA